MRPTHPLDCFDFANTEDRIKVIISQIEVSTDFFLLFDEANKIRSVGVNHTKRIPKKKNVCFYISYLLLWKIISNAIH